MIYTLKVDVHIEEYDGELYDKEQLMDPIHEALQTKNMTLIDIEVMDIND